MRHPHANREFYNYALIVGNSTFVIQSTVMVVVKVSTKQIGIQIELANKGHEGIYLGG